jgi:hypothetical protein
LNLLLQLLLFKTIIKKVSALLVLSIHSFSKIRLLCCDTTSNKERI